MILDTNQEATVTPEATEAETSTEVAEIKLSKAEYDELLGYKSTVGSLKREIKDLRKPKETETREVAPESTPNNGLIEKTFLRSAGIVAEDEVDLARTTARKWGLEIDQVVDDPDFQVKLERLRTDKANKLATSDIKGNGTGTPTKETTDYWKAKGVPPTPDQVPDRSTRAKIIRQMMSDGKNKPKFYNQ